MLHLTGPKGAPLVILLHGGPSIYGYMQTLAEALPSYRVLRYAQRGTVENPANGRPLTIADHLTDLDDIITEHCGRERPVLVGHSWGANLGLMFAARFPERLSHLIVLGTAPLTQELENRLGQSMMNRISADTQMQLTQVDDQIRNLLPKAPEPKHSETLHSLAQQRLALIDSAYHSNQETSQYIPSCSFDFRSFIASKTSLWELIENGEIPQLLQQIQAPVTAFHGDTDVIPCDATLDFLKSHIEHVQTHRIADAGHFIWLEPQARTTVLNQLRTALES